MSRRKFLITGALPYSNGRLHVGHVAGAYLPADILVRYLRARGDDVLFICGSDDNGVAALKSARDEGISVEELTAKYHSSQRQAFEGLGIRFDIYGGTHQPEFVEIHNRFSQEFFLAIYNKNYFTKRKTKQLYDTEAHQFLPDRFVKGTCPYCTSLNAYGDQCENCGRSVEQTALINPISALTGSRPEPRDTTHWYLRLDQLQGKLAQWLESKRRSADGPPWRPVVLNQSLGRIQVEGLPERAMTRDLTWGVPVPLDDPDAAGKSLYVWFDAPIGYVSFTAALLEQRGLGAEAYADYWKNPDCKILHFIGEDNIVFHAITWPAMLLATHEQGSIQGNPGEYQLPSNVVANCFLNIKFPHKSEAEKMSKSRGTAVWIEEYLKDSAPDPLRYYLTAIAPESQRTPFEFADFIARNNGELGNALGNFFNRCIKFAHQYFDGRVPEPGERQAEDHRQIEARREAVRRVEQALEAYQFRSALGEMMALARAGNGYFDLTKPFLSRKTDLAVAGRAINVCLQTARTLTTLMAPFLPFSAEKAAKSLGLKPDPTWSLALKELPAGHALGLAEVLFPRLEIAEETAKPTA